LSRIRTRTEGPNRGDKYPIKRRVIGNRNTGKGMELRGETEEAREFFIGEVRNRFKVYEADAELQDLTGSVLVMLALDEARPYMGADAQQKIKPRLTLKDEGTLTRITITGQLKDMKGVKPVGRYELGPEARLFESTIRYGQISNQAEYEVVWFDYGRDVREGA